MTTHRSDKEIAASAIIKGSETGYCSGSPPFANSTAQSSGASDLEACSATIIARLLSWPPARFLDITGMRSPEGHAVGLSFLLLSPGFDQKRLIKSP